jgi:aldehyde:ferredoxin oxidoreductase
MTFGYAGKILRVDLSKETLSEEALSEEDADKFLGGRALGAKILFDELNPGVDPLDPENKLVFATGVVTGAPFSGNCRYVVMAKSPLTGGWGESNASGFFGPELKFAGFDLVVFEGTASNPVYLSIKRDKPEIRDATRLWGKITGETQEQIRAELGDGNTRVACIGPGGENLVRYASILSDLHRASGRTGMGAVMGSKNLKAVAVRGEPRRNYADEKKLLELIQRTTKEVWQGGYGDLLQKYGTDGDLDDLNASGRLPTKAFQRATFEGADRLTGETMARTILKRRKGCYACVVKCIRIVETEKPYTVDPQYGGPEYETTAAFGSLCMNDDLVVVSKANELCNKLGIDTISTGVCIAFAMECYERGILKREDADGLNLEWGNSGAILALVENIAYRRGLGNVLAEGVQRTAGRWGPRAREIALTIKGQELPMHEPRGKKGLGLSYAVSNRGACHLQSEHDDFFEDQKWIRPEIGIKKTLDRLDTSRDKVELVKNLMCMWAVYDSLSVCKFTAFPEGGIEVRTLADIVSAIRGRRFDPSDLMIVGERALNLTRAFNVREGFSRKDDDLPARLKQKLVDGAYAGEHISQEVLDHMLDDYYDLMGWNRQTAAPTRERLERLGLGYVASALR